MCKNLQKRAKACISNIFGPNSKMCTCEVRVAWGRVSRGLTVPRIFYENKRCRHALQRDKGGDLISRIFHPDLVVRDDSYKITKSSNGFTKLEFRIFIFQLANWEKNCFGPIRSGDLISRIFHPDWVVKDDSIKMITNFLKKHPPSKIKVAVMARNSYKQLN